MAELVIAAVTGKEMEDIQFENNRCIYLPYKKVTKENVETMIKQTAPSFVGKGYALQK